MVTQGQETRPRRGLLIILSSPSGAGKTTLARRLLEEFPGVRFSVSYTTRAPRGSERDGIDYHFVDADEFARMIAAGELAEWAEVHGNRYGTAKEAVERALEEGIDVIFDIDWQGGRALASAWPEEALKIFLLPPDYRTLEGRLRGRGTDADDVIRRRLAKAMSEIEHYREYEHVIVNDDLERAYRVLRAIYLLRLLRRGGAGGADDGGELARLVAANRAAGPERHAEALLAEGARASRP